MHASNDNKGKSKWYRYQFNWNFNSRYWLSKIAIGRILKRLDDKIELNRRMEPNSGTNGINII